jgi:hypothetical protein
MNCFSGLTDEQWSRVAPMLRHPPPRRGSGVRRDQMGRTLAALMGAAHGLAIDRCDLPSQRRAQADQRADEACFELLWVGGREHLPEGFVRRDALLQRDMTAQPLQRCFFPNSTPIQLSAPTRIAHNATTSISIRWWGGMRVRGSSDHQTPLQYSVALPSFRRPKDEIKRVCPFVCNPRS